MIDQFKNEIQTASSWKEQIRKARKAFLLQALILLNKSGQKMPPFDPFAVAKLRKIHTITWVDSGEEACLIPDPKGFHLILRKPEDKRITTSEELKRHTRIRSTVAHEIGHTFFFDIENLPPRGGPAKYRFQGIPTKMVRTKEEWWCFDFARQLLLPDFYLKKFLSGHIPHANLDLALIIKEKFNVSWDVLLRKLVYDLKTWKTCTIFRFQVDGREIVLKNRHRNLWRGINSKIKDTDVWLSKNASFLRSCLHRIGESDHNVGNAVTFKNLEDKYLAEFLEIYPKPPTFLCLIKEGDESLEEYVSDNDGLILSSA
jgi:hypothetical protein